MENMIPYEVYKVGKEWKVKLGYGIETFKTKKQAEKVSKAYFDLDNKEGKLIAGWDRK